MKKNYAQKGISVLSWQKKLREKKVSSEEIVRYYLEQIKRKDPLIHSFLSLNPQALKEARQADKEIKKGVKNKPLLGIPIAIKDNFCTKDLPTTASSKVLENYCPPYEATVIKKLKKAGAIILGKTNMDAWAHGSSTETSDFGPTRNPHHLDYAPGGSSGGSAAAVAADLSPAAIGSETAGSIRQPAAWCGIVGFKPTYGRISRYGLIAMASSLDCPGPLTKTVADAALIYNILAGPDPHDATTIKEKPLLINLKQPLPKITIGVPKEYLKLASSTVRKKFNAVIKTLKKMKITIKEVSLLDPQISMAVYTIVQRAEVSSNLARYDGIRFGQDRSFFGEEAKRRILLGTFVLSAGYFDRYYLLAQKARTKIIQDFSRVFKRVNLLLSPTSPTTPLKIGEWEKYPFFGEKQDILVEASALAGLPGININAGFSHQHLPIGIQIFGPQKQENLILSLAHRLEKELEKKDEA